MFKNLLLTVVSLSGLAVSAPAQLEINGQLGRHISVSANIGVANDHYRSGPRHGGYYKTVYERVWVPGYYREEYVPAEYGWVCDRHGHRCWEVVTPAYTRSVWVPGYWDTQARRVWIQGHRRQGPYRVPHVVTPPRGVRNPRGVQSPRGVHTPRGVQSPRGVHNPRGGVVNPPRQPAGSRPGGVRSPRGTGQNPSRRVTPTPRGPEVRGASSPRRAGSRTGGRSVERDRVR